MTGRPALQWVLAIGLLLGCSANGEQDGDEPADTEVTGTDDHEDGDWGRPYVVATTDPDRMYAEPETAAAGDTIEVHFPGEDNRGPGFVLERRASNEWVWEWSVSSDTADPDPRVWSAEEHRERGVEWVSGPGFHDEGPHRVPVPEEAEVGEYRVCTAGGSDALCAEFRVTDP